MTIMVALMDRPVCRCPASTQYCPNYPRLLAQGTYFSLPRNQSGAEGRDRDTAISELEVASRPIRPIPMSSGCRLSSVSNGTNSLFRLSNDVDFELSKSRNPRTFLNCKIPSCQIGDFITIVIMLHKCGTIQRNEVNCYRLVI
jgi:hypothetical protein